MLAIRSTSARRSARVSSRNGASACSCSQLVGLGQSRDWRAARPAGPPGAKLPSSAGLRSRGSPSSADLHREEPLVDDLPEPVHDPRAVEVDARRALVLERVEAARPCRRTSSACAWVCRRIASKSGWPGVTHSRLARLGRLAVGRAARVAVRERRELPVRRPARSGAGPRACAPARRCAAGSGSILSVSGTNSAASRRKRAMVSGTTRRSCARARRSISISRLSFLARQPLQGVLADGAELALVDVAEQALLEVGVAELARRSSRAARARRGPRAGPRRRR